MEVVVGGGRELVGEHVSRLAEPPERAFWCRGRIAPLKGCCKAQ